MRLSPLTTAVLLLGGSIVTAHQPMDTDSIMERDTHLNSFVAFLGEIDTSFSPRSHHPRSIFQKRQTCDSSSNICYQTSTIARCCPSGYTCYYDDDWRCRENILSGLTRGQKIGIGIGAAVGFLALCIIGFVIFFCCCRKVVQAATGAVSGNNNDNNQGAYPPQQPVLYGHTGHAYDPTAIPLAQVGGDGKPYVDQTGYYPPQAPPQQQQQGGYGQYGQQQYPPPPPPQGLYPQSTSPAPPPPQGLYPQSTSPAPPYQQPPPPQGTYH